MSAAQPVERWLHPRALAYAADVAALGGVLAVAVGYRATFLAMPSVVAPWAATSLLARRRHLTPA